MENTISLKTEKFEDYSVNLLDDYKELLPELTDIKATVDKAVENIIKDNPDFRGVPFEQLKGMARFKTALTEYLNPSAFEILKSVVPKKHVKPDNKLVSKITKDEVEFDLIVGGGKAKKEVLTKVMLYYDEEKVKLSGREKFMPYDREVYDGVVSLYEAGNNMITPAMVYRAMNGLTETEKISQRSLESVEKSLSKSMFIKITIDYTDEAKLYNKGYEEARYEGYLLAAEKIKVKINGEIREAYKLYRKPILYEYAQVSGQIITVPMKLLQTKDAVRSTGEVIVIRGYLLRQIERIKSGKSSSSQSIAYKGIYEELKILKADTGEVPYKKKTAKIRSHAKSILDEWIDEGYISEYSEYKDGKQISGVQIQV